MSPEEQALVSRALQNDGTLIVSVADAEEPALRKLIRAGVMKPKEYLYGDGTTIEYALTGNPATLP